MIKFVLFIFLLISSQAYANPYRLENGMLGGFGLPRINYALNISAGVSSAKTYLGQTASSDSFGLIDVNLERENYFSKISHSVGFVVLRSSKNISSYNGYYKINYLISVRKRIKIGAKIGGSFYSEKSTVKEASGKGVYLGLDVRKEFRIKKNIGITVAPALDLMSYSSKGNFFGKDKSSDISLISPSISIGVHYEF